MLLLETREINKACQKAAMSARHGHVFCSTGDRKKIRIVRAKTFKGVQKVLTLSSGRWVVPTKVWID